MTVHDEQRLDGRRILITRPADQAEPLASMLRDLGATPIVVPLIEITDPIDGGAALRSALEDVDHHDWVVVTSVNGASRVRVVLDDHPASSEARPQFAAVGSATADALGRVVDLVPTVQTAAGLVDAFPPGPGSVLVAQGEQAAPTVVDGLRVKGWTVTPVVAYRTEPTRPDAELIDIVRSADTVLFASGSAARAWSAAFGAQTPRVVVAIGPTTAGVAREVGLKVHVVATDNSLDGLVAAVRGYPLGQ